MIKILKKSQITMNKESIIIEAKRLVEKYGNKAIEVVNRRIESLPKKYCKEGDYAFLLLNEVEKLLSKFN